MITNITKLNSHYKYIIFDFDGTINNTEPGITATFKKVLDLYGVDYSNVDFRRHIGPPLEFSFKELMGGGDWQQALKDYRRIFVEDNAMLNSKPYDGIKDALKQLSKMNFVLAVATSKYEPFAIQSLEHLGLDGLFDKVYGQTERRGYKNEILAQLIADNGWDKSQCLMIGDTCYDIDGARDNGIDVVAVSYGFEYRDVLEKAQPNAVVDSVDELLQLLSSLQPDM